MFDIFSKTSSYAAIFIIELESAISSLIDNIKSTIPSSSPKKFTASGDANLFDEIPSAVHLTADEIHPSIQKRDFDNVDVIGQFNNSFIIAKYTPTCNSQGYLLVLDQHAIDERINYEKITSRTYNDSVQTLINNSIAKIDPFLSHKIYENLDFLKQYGYRFQEDDDGKLILKTVPTVCGEPLSLSGMFAVQTHSNLDLSEICGYADDQVKLRTSMDQLIANKACKLSVKICEPLKIEKMTSLVRALVDLKNPWVLILLF